MIVVAIIGILAAIAIPNFLRYQAKSRQSEAKTNLGAVFVGETAYFSENSRYGSFSEIGYALAATRLRLVRWVSTRFPAVHQWAARCPLMPPLRYRPMRARLSVLWALQLQLQQASTATRRLMGGR
jgi:hypothetical protein